MSNNYIPTVVQTKLGHWYFGAICPSTGEGLAIGVDESGQETVSAGQASSKLPSLSDRPPVSWIGRIFLSRR
jgi:hypothetical protein